MWAYDQGAIDERSELFFDFCALNGLVIGGPLSTQKKFHKLTSHEQECNKIKEM